MENETAAAASRRPALRTWSRFGALGRRPSEYEIVTHDMNHTLRDPPLELGPDRQGNQWLMRHRDGIRLTVPDWNAFRDPDQLTYRKYVTLQDDIETYIDATLQEFDRLGQTAVAPDFLLSCLTPSRFLAHGLQMMAAYLQQLAPSSYIGNCAAFQAADQLRRLQRVAYRTRQLADACPERGFGQTERRAWLESPAWQGLRKAVEHLLVSFDWDDAFVGLNLVVKPLADEITLLQFASVSRHLGSDLDALIADALWLDAERSRRWTIALCRFAIAENAANAEHLLALLARWRPLADDIMATGSDLLYTFSPDPLAGRRIAATVFDAWRSFLAEAGLQPMPPVPQADPP
jgi:hypothetical protein